MPSLDTVLLTGTHVDAAAPVTSSHPIYRIKGPDNSEVITGNTTAIVDIHYDITLPTYMFTLMVGYEHNDISATPSSGIATVVSSVQVGTGSNVALTFTAITPNSTAYTPTDGGNIGYCTIMYREKLKTVITGF